MDGKDDKDGDDAVRYDINYSSSPFTTNYCATLFQ